MSRLSQDAFARAPFEIDREMVQKSLNDMLPLTGSISNNVLLGYFFAHILI
ncbi:hypothetical protein Desaci_2200 [Desulfosporosinus acidiphilus SJ4]|uniref:Uncharacterized protein n=1 Tax=Desulfosporosinus acidiphilus (strain DSM 22704 / JCM 16185 / SJ4) TaxID=646529 RepID=I4D5T7_DESAJ|nr:hypothetical protein Desaci_2200 [Desulfosporosinus acidiphilus SJ4]